MWRQSGGRLGANENSGQKTLMKWQSEIDQFVVCSTTVIQYTWNYTTVTCTQQTANKDCKDSDFGGHVEDRMKKHFSNCCCRFQVFQSRKMLGVFSRLVKSGETVKFLGELLFIRILYP